MAKRVTYKSKQCVEARCQECGFYASSANGVGLAAIHSDKYDHWVDVDVYFSLSFRREGNDTWETKNINKGE